VASHERACANATYDPLHMVSSKSDATRDPDTESLLSQSADPRLAWVNRQMYLSLRSLDIELRREERVAECERPQATQMFEARAGGAGAGDGNANGGVASAVGGAPAGGIVAMAANSGTARSTLVRKSSVSGSGAGGNGATAQKFIAGSDNDIVARRLRKAAEQETNPALRAKLWKEYADYRQGMSVR
jgi:hypothetical protein